jgi:hypothetical protein
MSYSPRLLEPECYLYSDVPPRQTRHMDDTAPVAKYRMLSFRQLSGDLPQQKYALATGLENCSQLL